MKKFLEGVYNVTFIVLMVLMLIVGAVIITVSNIFEDVYLYLFNENVYKEKYGLENDYDLSYKRIITELLKKINLRFKELKDAWKNRG